MRVLVLGSGLGAVCRGYERFVLDLSKQLAANGLEVNCWGSADAPGIEGLPILGRDELQRLALERMRQHPSLRSLNGAELHDWVLHTEDQLFGIAAAARLRQEVQSPSPLLVYLKWQGGLVDAGGKSTALTEFLAQAGRAGRIHTVIHTDWVYPPVIEKLVSSGFAFHAITPWVVKRLLCAGVRPESIFELPMGIRSLPFRNVSHHRAKLRQAAGIPEKAFVVLTVGAFDNETKNFPYLVRDLMPLSHDQDFYWVVAGSRGREPAIWEQKARSLFGSRFVPFANLAFERMPDIYGLADLSLCGSLNETFGLCYIESQFAGLPCVMHDYPVTRWIAAKLPAELASVCMVDMRVGGNALAAVEQWRGLLSDSFRRANVFERLEQYRCLQEQRYAWEHLGAQFANAFQNAALFGASRQNSM